MTCPYHLTLPSLTFIPNRSTLTVLLMYSFLILSFLVTPIANLNIFISATSISSTYFFVTATVSSPYTIAGLSTELYTFPFTLAGNLRSQITPDPLLHPFHPACFLFFTSLLQPPLSYNLPLLDSKYLNSFTLGTFVSSIFTVSSSFPPFIHRYSVFDVLTFIPLLSNAYLQDSNLRSTSSLVSSQITISSTNNIVHGGSLLTSSVSLSIITANRNIGRVSTHSANWQTSFSERGNARIKLPFSGHIANKFRRPTILQLNIKGLTASKRNVLHHIAMQSEALVILLQETHCTDAEKLVLSNYQLAGSSLSRKHGRATFVHERLKYTLLDQSPSTSEIEWLCVDVDGYKIVNVYKPQPTRLLTLDLPVFPHPYLYAGHFNCRHADWGYDDNSPDGECLAGWASINCLALLYNAKDAASFYFGRWNTCTNPDLAFASVGPNSRLPDRCVLDKFPRSQHRPSLISLPRFAMAVPSMPVKRWNFRKAKWSHYIALTQRFCCCLTHLMWMRLTRNSVTPLKKQPKRLSHAGIEITIFRVGMQSVNPSIKSFSCLLRETTQVWLL